jgi:hypothetical protein
MKAIAILWLGFSRKEGAKDEVFTKMVLFKEWEPIAIIAQQQF